MNLKFFSKKFFIGLSLAVCAGLSAPAFGQSVVGEWELVGRKCQGKDHLIPIGNSAQTISFRRGGQIQYDSVSLHETMTREEFREEIMSKALTDFEEDREKHERLCRNGMPVGEEGADGEFIDLCSREGKKYLYDKWRNSRLDEAEKWFEENAPPEGADGPCRIASEGRYSLSGRRLTVDLSSETASPSCGMEGGGGGRRISGDIYFKDGDLYWIRPPVEESRKFCGSSNYEMILFRR